MAAGKLEKRLPPRRMSGLERDRVKGTRVRCEGSCEDIDRSTKLIRSDGEYESSMYFD